MALDPFDFSMNPAASQGVDPFDFRAPPKDELDLELLAKAQRMVESGGRHFDESGQLVTSPAGAVGSSQQMPQFFKDFGYGVPDLESTDEEAMNARQLQILQAGLKTFAGDLDKALAAYNAGFPQVKQVAEASPADWLNELPDETKAYPGKVKTEYEKLKAQQAAESADPFDFSAPGGDPFDFSIPQSEGMGYGVVPQEPAVMELPEVDLEDSPLESVWNGVKNFSAGLASALPTAFGDVLPEYLGNKLVHLLEADKDDGMLNREATPISELLFPEAKAKALEWAKGVVERNRSERAEDMLEFADSEWGQEAAYQAGVSTGLAGAPLLMWAASRGRLPVSMVVAPQALYSMAEDYNSSIEDGVAEQQAHFGSLINGAIEGILGYAPTRILLQGGHGVLKDFLLSMAVELPSELATTVLQTVNAAVTRKPDMTAGELKELLTSDEMQRSLLVTGGAALIGQGAAGAVAHGTPVVAQKALDLIGGERQFQAVVDEEAKADTIKQLERNHELELLKILSDEAFAVVQEKEANLQSAMTTAESETSLLKEKDLTVGKMMNLWPTVGMNELIVPQSNYNTEMDRLVVPPAGMQTPLVNGKPQTVPAKQVPFRSGQVLVEAPSSVSEIGKLDVMQNDLAILQKAIADGGYNGIPFTATRRQETLKDIADLKRQIKFQQKKAAEEQGRVDKIVNVVQGFVDEVFYNVKATPTIMKAPQFLVSTKPTLDYYFGAMQKVSSVGGDPTYIIHIPFNQQTDFDKNTPQTVAHELGHVFHDFILESLPSSMQSGLDALWKKKVAEAMDKPLSEFLADVTKPNRYENLKNSYNLKFTSNLAGGKTLREFLEDVEGINTPSKALHSQDKARVLYYVARREFFAETMAKQIMSGKSPAAKLIRKQYPQARKAMRELEKTLQVNFPTDQTVTDLLDYQGSVVKAYKSYIRHQEAKERFKLALEELEKNPPMLVTSKRVGGLINRFVKDVTLKERALTNIDKFNFFLDHIFSITHLHYANPQIRELGQFVRSHTNRAYFKDQIIQGANSTLKDIQQMVPKARTDDFNAFVDLVGLESDSLGRKLTRDEMEKVIADNKLTVTEDMLQAAEKLWTHYREYMYLMEEELVRDALEKHIDRLSEGMRLVAEYRKQFAAFRDRNYNPHTRFGDYLLRVEATGPVEYEGKKYRKGEKITFELFETKAQRDKAKKAWEGKLAKAGVDSNNLFIQDSMISHEASAFQGFPPQIVTMLVNGLNLTETQKQALNEEMHRIAPGQSYRKHLIRRKNVPGYSIEAMKVFADYSSRFANHISRIRYQREQQQILNDFGENIKNTKNATKRAKMLNMLTRHQKYVDNPGNELATLRALGTLLYLGLVPKSALVNLTQVPMVALPYLSKRSSYVKATAFLADATRDVFSVYNQGKNLTADDIQMKRRLAPLLNESSASELAAVREGSMIQKFLPGNARDTMGGERISGWLRFAAEKGMWAFSKTENLSRQITALAAFRMAKAGGMSNEAAVQFAEDTLRNTMFEYARFNRAHFMQGKQSVLFLFWQYMTNMGFFLYNDPAALRAVVQLLIVAGVSGAPGSENLQDLINYAMTKLKGNKWNMEQEIRKGIEQVLDGYQPFGVNAGDLVMNGLSGSLGPFDLSGSLSLGRPLPFTELLDKEGVETGAAVNQSLFSMGGAMAEYAMNIVKAIGSDDPDVWRRWENTLPMFARNISKATRRAVRGEETDRSGATLKEYDLTSFEDQVELLGQAMGFPSRELRIRQEAAFRAKEMVMYYQGRAELLMRRAYYFLDKGDFDGYEETLNSIRKFNDEVPDGVIGIDMKAFVQSLQQRDRSKMLKENGTIPQRKYQGLYREVMDIYQDNEPSRP